MAEILPQPNEFRKSLSIILTLVTEEM